MKLMKQRFFPIFAAAMLFLSLLILPLAFGFQQNSKGEKVEETKKDGAAMVLMETSLGEIKIELYRDRAPLTVDNFLSYVEEGFYDGTVFHRVIPGFVIQGGGFTADMERKPTKPPIKNEAANGLKNGAGTLSMARTSEVDSATSQFFINLSDNEFLDYGARDYGYAVFARGRRGHGRCEKHRRGRDGHQGHAQGRAP